MSFVSIVISTKFITVMSDGRVSGKNKEILDDKYKKFQRISPKQFIAYAGSKEVCEGIVSQIEYTNSKIYDLLDVTSKIKQAISSKNLQSINALFAIGGIDVNANLKVYLISNSSDEGIDLIQSESEEVISYKFLTSPLLVETIEREVMEKHFMELLKKTGFNTPNKCLKAQKLLSHYIAEIDRSVNKITYSFSVTI